MSGPDDLVSAALAARGRAYAPYSRFQVGAALRTEDGAVFAGCNVENAAYPVGSCAEAGAIAAMIAAGGKAIRAVLVFGEGSELVTPCGACRQRIAEFAGEACEIVSVRGGVPAERVAFWSLLPEAFGPRDLD